MARKPKTDRKPLRSGGVYFTLPVLCTRGLSTQPARPIVLPGFLSYRIDNSCYKGTENLAGLWALYTGLMTPAVHSLHNYFFVYLFFSLFFVLHYLKIE